MLRCLLGCAVKRAKRPGRRVQRTTYEVFVHHEPFPDLLGFPGQYEQDWSDGVLFTGALCTLLSGMRGSSEDRAPDCIRERAGSSPAPA